MVNLINKKRKIYKIENSRIGKKRFMGITWKIDDWYESFSLRINKNKKWNISSGSRITQTEVYKKLFFLLFYFILHIVNGI